MSEEQSKTEQEKWEAIHAQNSVDERAEMDAQAERQREKRRERERAEREAARAKWAEGEPAREAVRQARVDRAREESEGVKGICGPDWKLVPDESRGDAWQVLMNPHYGLPAAVSGSYPRAFWTQEVAELVAENLRNTRRTEKDRLNAEWHERRDSAEAEDGVYVRRVTVEVIRREPTRSVEESAQSVGVAAEDSSLPEPHRSMGNDPEAGVLRGSAVWEENRPVREDEAVLDLQPWTKEWLRSRGMEVPGEKSVEVEWREPESSADVVDFGFASTVSGRWAAREPARSNTPREWGEVSSTGSVFAEDPSAVIPGASWPVCEVSQSRLLPKGHWLYQEAEGGRFEAPPMPLRMGAGPGREAMAEAVRAAGRYAVRATTRNGREEDFDPDAMVQNFVVGLLGYWSDDGTVEADWANPDPVPPLFRVDGTLEDDWAEAGEDWAEAGDDWAEAGEDWAEAGEEKVNEFPAPSEDAVIVEYDSVGGRQEWSRTGYRAFGKDGRVLMEVGTILDGVVEGSLRIGDRPVSDFEGGGESRGVTLEEFAREHVDPAAERVLAERDQDEEMVEVTISHPSLYRADEARAGHREASGNGLGLKAEGGSLGGDEDGEDRREVVVDRLVVERAVSTGEVGVREPILVNVATAPVDALFRELLSEVGLTKLEQLAFMINEEAYRRKNEWLNTEEKVRGAGIERQRLNSVRVVWGPNMDRYVQVSTPELLAGEEDPVRGDLHCPQAKNDDDAYALGMMFLQGPQDPSEYPLIPTT